MCKNLYFVPHVASNLTPKVGNETKKYGIMKLPVHQSDISQSIHLEHQRGLDTLSPSRHPN